MPTMIYHGNLFDALPTLPENSIDACVTDPPYELGFMSKTWDQTGVAFSPKSWAEILRVLKPGAHLLAFGGTRTFHRITCAIEDAGFEIRDCLSWLYGSGFPKSLDISKAIDAARGLDRQVVGYDASRARPNRKYETQAVGNIGATGDGRICDRTDNGATITAPASPDAARWSGWGTALKPGWEPIILARKPLRGTVAANVLQHGTGALNIDACRIEGGGQKGEGGRLMSATGGSSVFNAGRHSAVDDSCGRWPANVVLDDLAAMVLDEQSGELGVSVGGRIGNAGGGNVPNLQVGRFEAGDPGYGDSGGASRFYYVAKPSREERDMGCYDLPPRSTATTVDRDADSAGVQNPRAGAGRGAGAPIYECARCGLNLQGGRAVTPCGDGAHEPVLVGYGESVRNHHPTVKPVELMRWLVRLVTPAGGTVIDPFFGSGTTGVACVLEQREYIGIEKDADYIEIARRRVVAAAPLFSNATVTRVAKSDVESPLPQQSLFDE